MHKNGLVKFIAIIFTLISILQISYTYVVSKVEKDSENYAISQIDPETVWNAFRFANFSLGKQHDVRTFLLEKVSNAWKLLTMSFLLSMKLINTLNPKVKYLHAAHV